MFDPYRFLKLKAVCRKWFLKIDEYNPGTLSSTLFGWPGSPTLLLTELDYVTNIGNDYSKGGAEETSFTKVRNSHSYDPYF